MSELNPDAQSAGWPWGRKTSLESSAVSRVTQSLPSFRWAPLEMSSIRMRQDLATTTKEDSQGHEQVITSLGLSFPNIYAYSFMSMPLSHSYTHALTHIAISSC